MKINTRLKLEFYYILSFLGKSTNTNGEHDTEAVYIGAVGPRFEKPNFMEWQEMMISSKSIESGLKDSPITNLFLKFYSERLDDFGATEKIKDNLDLVEGTLNDPIYMERITIIAEYHS